MKRQIFVLGASSAYGVGAPSGWADLLKQHIWSLRSRPDSSGDELYNLAKSGEQVGFVHKNYKTFIKIFGRDNAPKMAIIGCGANDAKKSIRLSDGRVTNANTPARFRKTYKKLLDSVSPEFDKIIVLGFTWVDESKTAYKPSTFAPGFASSFINDRVRLFSETLRELCAEYKNITFINAPDFDVSCVAADGLHPNERGHKLIFDSVRPYAESFINGK
ncbi:MAG: GDSL-type esterase/lipase family protein [Rickettsiales bacterium]|jgi:lysophospholipase L1-like esterase|nr:GDSL-type esterase/lipase family protein [Rickettsiales bacterium]